jgi:aldehyde dehydrogenase (NAD+)
VNIVNGYGNPTGDLIARHPGIRKVAFTGSSLVGHKIVIASAETNLKKVLCLFSSLFFRIVLFLF